MTIRAIYEKGVFKPTESVSLPEGTAAEVIVPQTQPPATLTPSRDSATILSQISAIPPDKTEVDDGLVGSSDAERILYGGSKGAL